MQKIWKSPSFNDGCIHCGQGRTHFELQYDPDDGDYEFTRNWSGCMTYDGKIGTMLRTKNIKSVLKMYTDSSLPDEMISNHNTYAEDMMISALEFETHYKNKTNNNNNENAIDTIKSFINDNNNDNDSDNDRYNDNSNSNSNNNIMNVYCAFHSIKKNKNCDTNYDSDCSGDSG